MYEDRWRIRYGLANMELASFEKRQCSPLGKLYSLPSIFGRFMTLYDNLCVYNNFISKCGI